MTLPVQKVEIGFNLTGANAPLFTLDNSVKGVLDNTDFPLSGTIFFDVTARVKSVAIQRGKNRQFGQFDAGLANVVFLNNDRTFDPEYEQSPFFGQIIPKREIRISSGGERTFTGVVDDWNLSYSISGLSEASASCSDAFSVFNNQVLSAQTFTAQTSGERVSAVLDDPNVNWNAADRSIETGQSVFGSDSVLENTNALSYLRQIEASEPGQLFVGKNGNLTFKDRNPSAGSSFLTFSDNANGIGYETMEVVYGSELLHNEIILTNLSGTTATVTDEESIAEYGRFVFTYDTSLVASGETLANIALLLANAYSQPEYRFESLSITLDKFDPATQSQILNLEIGNVVEVQFTPNKIPPAIIKLVEITQIQHAISPASHIITFGFSTIDKGPWTLSDAAFGRLSANNVLSF